MDKKKYKIYITWMAQAPQDKKPIDVFAKDENISKDDIKSFKESTQYLNDLIVATKKWGRERIPELVHKLYEASKNSGNNKVIESFIDMIQIDDQDEQEDIISITKFSDEQRKQIIDRITGRGGFDRPGIEEKPVDILSDGGHDIPSQLAPRVNSGETGRSIL